MPAPITAWRRARENVGRVISWSRIFQVRREAKRQASRYVQATSNSSTPIARKPMAPISTLAGRRGKPRVNTLPATSKYPSQLVIRPRLRILVIVGTSRPNFE
ncbi:hypothetical protein D9M73_259000 [compost metagenome]